MTKAKEQYDFQADTSQLLDLMIHSLYTKRDIFLRELISNASDALDRLRFESLTSPGLIDANQKWEVRLECDTNERTLTIIDTGIGMSREEVIANLGTIARSGTRELRQKVSQQSANSDALIGQFGVGFYSAFMVAGRVKVITRRAGEAGGTEWESDGSSHYTVRDADKRSAGTSITLYLKATEPDAGLEDYTDRWRLSSIVRRYSDFINYPIVMRDEHEEEVDGKKTTTYEDKTLNSMKPVWSRPPAEVTAEQYADFYRYISHEWDEPVKRIHFRAEGTFEYQALLFVPAKAPYDLHFAAAESGLRLYSRRVMIVEKCEDLLPRYLRFMKGVVDAADLPLNISRQRLQQDAHLALIRKRLTHKVLEALGEMYTNDAPGYLKFWNEFGRTLKEGASSDFANKDRLLNISLFQSSHDAVKLTTLKDYVSRMLPDQNQILYVTAVSRQAAESSPHVEAARQKGFEILYLVEPVDELLLQHLPEYEGKKLKSAAKGNVELGDQPELEEKRKEYRDLTEMLQRTLNAHVKEVRVTNRLIDSPACLVVEDAEYSPLLERSLMKGKGFGTKKRRILEVNPAHRLVERMRERHRSQIDDPILEKSAQLLFGIAVLAEGSELPDPVGFNRAACEITSALL